MKKRQHFFNNNGSLSPDTGSYLGFFVVLFVIILIFTGRSAAKKEDKYSITPDAYENMLEDFTAREYKKSQTADEGCLFITLVYDSEQSHERSYYVQNNQAWSLLYSLQDNIDKSFYKHEHQSVEKQLNILITELIDEFENSELTPLKASSDFSAKCFKDKDNLITDSDVLVEAARQLYDKTGIQLYVVVVSEHEVYDITDGYEKYAQKEKTSFLSGLSGILAGTLWKTVKILIVLAIIITILVFVLAGWYSRTEKNKKEKERIDDILSKPLETYEEQEARRLAEKYDPELARKNAEKKKEQQNPYKRSSQRNSSSKNKNPYSANTLKYTPKDKDDQE